MSKPVITFVFKYHAIGCFGTYFTHVQTCNVIRVQSATQSTASGQTFHMPKPVITFVFKCYAIDCFGTYFTHAPACDNVRVQMLRNRLPRYIYILAPLIHVGINENISSQALCILDMLCFLPTAKHGSGDLSIGIKLLQT